MGGQLTLTLSCIVVLLAASAITVCGRCSIGKYTYVHKSIHVRTIHYTLNRKWLKLEAKIYSVEFYQYINVKLHFHVFLPD